MGRSVSASLSKFIPIENWYVYTFVGGNHFAKEIKIEVVQ